MQKIDESVKLAVIVGDTHLAERTWSSRRALTGDSFHSFLQAVQIAEYHRVPMILMGDIFDSKSMSSVVMQFFCRCMDRLQSAGISVYYIQGNHDYAIPPWPAVHSWPTHLDQKYVVLGEQGAPVQCYGLDFYAMPGYTDKLAAVPEVASVLVTHQAWEDFGKMGSSLAASSSMLPRGLPVISGDLHMAIIKTGHAANGDLVTLISPGATCMQAIDEPTQHSVLLLCQNESGGLTIHPEQLQTRQKIDVTCTSQEDFDAACVAISKIKPTEYPVLDGNDINMPIVRVTYPISLSPDSFVRLKVAAAGRVHLFTNPQVPEVVTSVIDPQQVFEAASLLSVERAIQLLESEPQQERDLAVRMYLEADDVSAFLSNLSKERENADHSSGAEELLPA